MNILIKNTGILLYRPDMHVVQGDLAIADGVILSVGQVDAAFRPDKVLDGTGRLAMPGLVNCHTHLYMTLMRNFADDLPFKEWLFDNIMPKEDLIGPEDAYWCNLLSCMEMIRSGTTCFLDMHMFRHQSLRASQEAGLRAVLSRGIVGADAADDAGLGRLEDTLAELAACDSHNGMVSCMLGPHAIYTCGEGLLRHLVGVAKEKQLRMHIHLSETKAEVDDCVAAHGCTPVEYLARMGIFDVPTIAAHCVWVSDDDIAILKQHGVHVATNPVSNMKLGNGFAPIPKMLDAGINVCVGTDSAASNNSLNMFRELGVLSYIHKGVAQDPLVLNAKQVLQCGTINGAAALGMADRVGTIEAGKRADLILLDLSAPQLNPLNNLPASLVYSATGAEVDTVIVDGRVMMENRAIQTIDEERVLFEVAKIRERILL